MMRKIIVTLFSCLAMALQAADGIEILDKASQRITATGSAELSFTATAFSGTQPQGSSSGQIRVKGQMFKIITDEMITWYNGQTQWSMMPGSGEVNMTVPTEEEKQAVNPYAFIQLYKHGYKASVKKGSLRNTDTYEVHLTATDSKQEIKEIYVDVRKSDYTLLCIRLRQNTDWHRIVLHSIQAVKDMSDSEFSFPAQDYPDVEIIDLR
ncbi:MAG: LolA-like putative outer membrane lipoprotein chaperone [Bacteroidaceae bacterium]